LTINLFFQSLNEITHRRELILFMYQGKGYGGDMPERCNILKERIKDKTPKGM
jgi:hypothetical protein